MSQIPAGKKRKKLTCLFLCFLLLLTITPVSAANDIFEDYESYSFLPDWLKSYFQMTVSILDNTKLGADIPSGSTTSRYYYAGSNESYDNDIIRIYTRVYVAGHTEAGAYTEFHIGFTDHKGHYNQTYKPFPHSVCFKLNEWSGVVYKYGDTVPVSQFSIEDDITMVEEGIPVEVLLNKSSGDFWVRVNNGLWNKYDGLYDTTADIYPFFAFTHAHGNSGKVRMSYFYLDGSPSTDVDITPKLKMSVKILGVTPGYYLNNFYFKAITPDGEEDYAGALDSNDTIQLTKFGKYTLYWEKPGYESRQYTNPREVLIDDNKNYYPAMGYEADNASIKIYIKDYNTGSDIDNVVVKFYAAGTWELIKTQTIISGEPLSLPIGNYYCNLTKSGYRQLLTDYDTRLTVGTGSTSTTFYMLSTGSPEPTGPPATVTPTTTITASPTTTSVPSGSGRLDIKVFSGENGNIIANTEICVKNTNTGVWYNETAVSGNYVFTLPYGAYSIYVEKTGYYQPYQYAGFTLNQPYEAVNVFIYPLITPTEGKIIVYFYVRNSNYEGVNEAVIKIDGEEYTTNLQGFATIELNKSTQYTAEISRSGYISTTYTFTTTDQDIMSVSALLFFTPLVTPIYPTEPPITIPPTGGYIPPEQYQNESSFIGQAGKALSNAFGVTESVGLMMLGIFISLAIATGTAQKLNKGTGIFGIAFVAGLGLTALMGLVPIWVFILFAIGVGAYVGNKYFISGNEE